MCRLENDRGISTILGSILLFGLVIALVVLGNAVLVPATVAQDEFDHNQRVQGDLTRIGSAVSVVAATGTGRSVVVETSDTAGQLGDGSRVSYLRTEPSSFVLENVTTGGNAAKFWTGTDFAVDSRAVVYRPNYDQYGTAPVTRYEGWVAYNDFGDEQVVLASTPFVDGDRIELVAITGDVQFSTAEVDLAVHPVSVPHSSVAVRNASAGPITLTVESGLNAAEWREVLADELAPEGRVVAVTDLADGRVRFTFAPGTYQLRMSRVHLGAETVPEPPRYLADVELQGGTVVEGETYEVVLELRDRFNNPVQSGGGLLVASQPAVGRVYAAADPSTNATTPDADGRARFVYVAPDDVPESTEVEFEVTSTGVTDPAGEVTVSLGVRPRGDFVIENGSVVPNRPFTATVQLIGSAITYGTGPDVPVAAEVTVGNRTLEPWPADVNDHANPRYYSVTNRPAGTAISVTATSAVFSVKSTEDTAYVYVLRNGDPVPPVQGYLNQASAQAFVAPYIDPATYTVVLEENQAIFLFELGVRDLSSPAADFQDAVVVVNIYYE